VWSESYDQPMLLVSGHHSDDSPSMRDNNVEGKKGRVKFPCRLCGGTHYTHLCPRMDEASYLLEKITVIEQNIPSGYHKFSPSPSLVDEVVDSTSFAIDPTLAMKSDPPLVDELVNFIMPSVNPVQEETSLLLQDSFVAHEQPLVSFQEFIPKEPLVDLITELVNPTPSLVDQTLPIESDLGTDQVFYVISHLSGRGDIMSHTTVPSPSSEVCSFDWNSLVEAHLP